MRIVFARVAVNRHLNFCGLVDHVVIREDEALVIHDYARSEDALGIRAVIRRSEKEIEEILKRVVQMMRTLRAAFRLLDHLRGGDIYDGRAYFFRNARKGTRRSEGIGNGQQ